MTAFTFGNILLAWYSQNKRDLPWRNTRDPYLIWLSEIILQQTRVDQGMNYYLRFAEKYPVVNKLASAKEEEVLKLWQGLGYYSRARNLHATAKTIVQEYESKFPETFLELFALKGIGEYTASAISSFAFGKKEAVVDGNVYRFLSRYFGIRTPINSSKAKVEFRKIATELMSDHSPRDFNQAIMEFGSRQCKPGKPDCSACPFSTSCFAFLKKKVSAFPVKVKKNTIRNRYFNYLVLRDGKNFYLRKREGNDIWKNLYEFPSIETSRVTSETKIIQSKEWNSIFGKREVFIDNIHPEVRHLLSHQKLHVKFFEIKVENSQSFRANKDWKKVNVNSVKRYAVPKVIENYLNK